MTESAAVLAPEWLSAEEARRRTGWSASKLARKVKIGNVQSRLEPREGRKPERLYRTADLQPITQALVPVPPVRDLPLSLAVRKPKPKEAALAVPLDKKLWLTLKEASAYSGLRRISLQALVKNGELKARRDGPYGALVIRRVSLEGMD